jgi:membrane-bound serine protease (ClpP class)
VDPQEILVQKAESALASARSTVEVSKSVRRSSTIFDTPARAAKCPDAPATLPGKRPCSGYTKRGSRPRGLPSRFGALVLPFLMIILLAVLPVMGQQIHLIELDGAVGPGTASYIVSGIEEAEAAGVSAVVIVIDTPGGLLDSTRDIVKAELGSEVPIIAYVSPAGSRAGSAGVFITMAAHIAVMAPGTTIGAAHPVSAFGGDESTDPDETIMGEKVMNDTLAWARAIAEQRNRPMDWSEDSVRESKSVTSREALEQGIIDLVAEDLDDLLQQVHGMEVTTPSGTVVLDTAGATQHSQEMVLTERLLHFLGDPNVLYALIALGLLALYVEFHNPGLVVPGVLGVAMLVAAGIGLSIVPFNVGGLLLVALGFVLFALEIWIPSYGALTVGGILSLAAGGVLLFNGEDPVFDLRVSTSTIAAVALTVGGIVAVVVTMVIRAQRRRPAIGAEGLPGETAEVTTGGEGGGWVMVDGAIWKATWSGSIPTGAVVKVMKVQSLCLTVQPLEPPPDLPTE